MENLFTIYYDSPIGTIEITAIEAALYRLIFVEAEKHAHQSRLETTALNAVLTACCTQLDEYFAHQRRDFDLPLGAVGTPFRQQVWGALLTIPYGKTMSYGQLAQQLGDPKSVRAVGTANGANPISLIVPCHRVIGADGKLVGYGGDLWRKEWLLRHEGALLF